MLTLRVVRQGRENYYLRQSEGESRGEFLGAGADILGITGAVADKDSRLLHLFQGKHPLTGIPLRTSGLTPRTYKSGDGNTKTHRPVVLYDGVINAPKAFSILALATTPEKKAWCLELHRKACLKIYAEIEDKSICRRRGKRIQALPVLVAQTHLRSRELEPHLHTHILILNTALLADDPERGGALDAKELFRLALPLGQQYRSRLRELVESELKLSTYPIQIANGESFGIEGISPTTEDFFSTRSNQIKDHLKKRGKKTGKTSEVRLSVLKTRAGKAQGVPQDELERRWQQERETIERQELELERYSIPL
jgi:conjugative relaxase-like TrwC/TraI family protein